MPINVQSKATKPAANPSSTPPCDATSRATFIGQMRASATVQTVDRSSSSAASSSASRRPVTPNAIRPANVLCPLSAPKTRLPRKRCS